MAIRTRFLDGNDKPMSDVQGRPLITDYVGPLAAGTKLKIGSQSYEVTQSLLEIDVADGSLGHLVNVSRRSVIADWTVAGQFRLALAMIVVSVLFGGLIYWAYASNAPIFWAALGLRHGVPVTILLAGSVIALQVKGSFFGRQPPTVLGLYLSVIFLWGSMFGALAWWVLFVPPPPIDLWSNPTAYVDFFHQEFDPFKSTVVAALGSLSTMLGFLGLAVFEKAAQFVQSKLKP